ncbi:MAG: flagellar filament capping protein FliD [Aquincola sp.]|nr:flagellar filament capping protein FliD [Aquincola sp.]MDH5330859.1 flagellar filament capping protein FliD [Aquincola sp.]
MATISAAGIGSGLDINSIVTQLVAIEREPISRLKTAATKIESQISAFGRLKSALAKLRDASAAFTTPAPWTNRLAASADPTTFDARITGTGVIASHALRPTALAATQANASTAFAAADSVVGTGTLTIDIGTWTGTTSFAPKAGSTAVTITLGAGDDTLERIRDKINEANAGVAAEVVFDGTNYRLTVTSRESGATNGFRITAVDSDGSNTNGSGLSQLTYNPPGGTSRLTRNVTAADATATLDGLAIRSTSNTFDRALQGVSFTIKKTSTTALGLDIAFDRDSLKKGVEDFVAAYNELNSLARSLTQVVPGNAASNGPLQGDRGAANLQSRLRSLLAESGAGGTLARLADAGVTAGVDGTLSIDSTKLEAAVGQPDELRKLFDADAATPGSAGLMRRLRDMVDDTLGVDGTITSRTDGLQERLQRNQRDQDRLEARIALVEKRLRAQYGALDTRMASLNSLSSYVTQQMQALNNFYNTRNNNG